MTKREANRYCGRISAILGVCLLATTAISCRPSVKASTLPFKEDFGKGNDSGWKHQDGTWSVIDGEYVGRDVADTWSVAGDPAWTDYACEARVKIPMEKGRAKLVTRHADENNLVSCELQSDKGIFGIWECQKGVWSNLATFETPIEPDKWYTVKVEVQGPSVKGYLDGVEKVSGKTQTSAGRIGVGANEEAHFDDISVTALGDHPDTSSPAKK